MIEGGNAEQGLRVERRAVGMREADAIRHAAPRNGP